MGKIYLNQTKLRLTFNIVDDDGTAVDITSSTVKQIKYRKPDGTTGNWTATSDDESTGIIYYDIAASTDLDVVGTWIMWGYITFSDSNSAASEYKEIKVYTEGR